MPSLHSLPAVIFTLLSVAAMAYSILSLFAARNFLRQKWSAPTPANNNVSPVSILKPLKGCDPHMYESFRSHCVQGYPEFEIIFGVNNHQDEAAPLVERLKQEFPQIAIKLMVCEKALGANGKVSSIVQMLDHARYDHIIINDSDIRVPAGYLSDVMREFNAPAPSSSQVGIVTCLYRAVPGHTLWSKLEALGVAVDFIPGALTARFLEGRVRFGLGSTLAVSREALKAAGSMEPLVDYLADDYELASRIVKTGYRVVVPRVIVETFLPDYSFSKYFQHQLRWGRAVRSSRPGGYLGLSVTYGMFWAALNIVATHAAAWSWMLLAIVLLSRGAVLRVSAKSILGDRIALRNFWLLPLLDLISPFIWLLSIAGNRIIWRGEEFILKSGKLRRV